MVALGSGVVFYTGNGGTVRMIGTSQHLNEVRLENSFAAFDDLHINPNVDVTLDISDGLDVNGTVKHVTGDPVMHFSLASRVPNGTADILLTGLQPEEWYRLQFDGVLAECSGGRAHGQTDTDGKIQFNSVVIPYE